MSLRLYLVRHGETEWSLSGQYTGRTDIPLTAHGEEAARELGSRIQDIPFTRMLTSPLKRAQQTCTLAGLSPTAEIEPDLAEWDNGDDEGRTPEDILASRPDWNLFRDGSPHGEAPIQISERADRLISRLRKLEDNVALFSHGHFGRVLAARWIGLSVEQAQHLLLDTASLSILCYEHDRTDQPAIALWNSDAKERTIGEDWLLSDRDDHPSLVADGPLKGNTLKQLLDQSPQQLMGRLAARFPRFPLLLKYLDVHDKLSVQVHPSDQQAKYLPASESGKTEAWVMLEAGKNSRIYAGLKTDTTQESLKQALANATVADCLASFKPNPSDAVLIPAGTVHSLEDIVVFEVQENSDVTFRLDDWNHIDAKTGKPRPLQVEQALDCIDYEQVEVRAIVPVVNKATPKSREQLFDCKHLGVWRLHTESPTTVGIEDTTHALVCIDGEGQIEHGGDNYAVNKGEVLLLPAVVGACLCRPHGAVKLLEISLPEVN